MHHVCRRKVSISFFFFFFLLTLFSQAWGEHCWPVQSPGVWLQFRPLQRSGGQHRCVWRAGQERGPDRVGASPQNLWGQRAGAAAAGWAADADTVCDILQRQLSRQTKGKYNVHGKNITHIEKWIQLGHYGHCQCTGHYTSLLPDLRPVPSKWNIKSFSLHRLWNARGKGPSVWGFFFFWNFAFNCWGLCLF